MNFYELINTRYSVRKYTDQPVPEAAVVRILEAARLAPSAANYQPWHFFVVRDPAVRKALFPNERQAWITEAPVVLVACGTPGKAWVRAYDQKNHLDIDLAIAMDHMVLAATEEGFGTCWICAFDPAVFRSVLKLPAGMEPIAAPPRGGAADTPPPPNPKPHHRLVTVIG
jgi:nitroreductase